MNRQRVRKRDAVSRTPSRVGSWLGGLLLAVVMAHALGLGPARPAHGQGHNAGKPPAPGLRASEILNLAKSLVLADATFDAYPLLVKLGFENSELQAKDLIAFEENGSFAYALGACTLGGSARSLGESATSRESAEVPRLFRRLIVLKPAILVVDDEVINPGSQVPVRWHLYCQKMPEAKGGTSRLIEGENELSCEALLPRKASYRLEALPTGDPESRSYSLRIESQDNSARTRFLQVFHVNAGGPQNSRAHSKLIAKGGEPEIVISTSRRAFRLNLPPPSEGAGEIAISMAGGKALLENRPLPSGILPHGPEGSRLLERWDADYRASRPPAWDIGRPADELRRVVSEGAVRKCRAVDLCCGSGSDAIYLARQGFDVTAIDVAPTALSQAEQKARRAGASVRWVLADVLKPPSLDPFDFIYDRGCYHVVRNQNVAAYLETVRRLSRPGTQFLLLAARRDGQASNEGTEGVTEEELRFDFLPLFNLDSLREIRLESNRPGMSPPGWAALLRRAAKP